MAAENGVQNAELGYLLFPFEQYSNLAGKPLVGGHMEIYEAGTDTKYISYSNWDGAENTFRIPIPNDGRITVLADPAKTFDCYLYDSYNNLVCSRLNVQANVPGNISISGADTRVKNTDGTLDVSLRTLGNNIREYTVNTHNKVLDVQDPLYFVENSNTATVIGFSGDSSSSISGKMDESKLEYNEYGKISAYNGSAFANQGGGGGAGDPEVNDLVHSTSATWNNVSAKLDTTAFSTVSGNFLTAHQSLDGYAKTEDVESAVSNKLDTTAFSDVSGSFLTSHQDLSDYATTAELANKLDTTAFSTASGSFLTAHQDLSDYLTKVSADGLYYPLNSNPSGYLTAHQDLSQYTKTEDLTAYQAKGDYYSASNPSGFLTKNSADTLYQPTGDYATHDNLTAYQTVEGMTAYQPSGNYADTTALDGKVDTSTFTAYSSTTNEKIEYISGALSGTYELSAGEGIDITDYPNEQKTVISASYNETVLFDGSLTGSTSARLSENVNNFNRVKVFYSRDNAWILPLINSIEMFTDVLSGQLRGNFTMGSLAIDFTNSMDGWYYATVANITDDVVRAITGRNYKISSSAAFNDNYCVIKRIIGINRIDNN